MCWVQTTMRSKLLSKCFRKNTCNTGSLQFIKNRIIWIHRPPTHGRHQKSPRCHIVDQVGGEITRIVPSLRKLLECRMDEQHPISRNHQLVQNLKNRLARAQDLRLISFQDDTFPFTHALKVILLANRALIFWGGTQCPKIMSHWRKTCMQNLIIHRKQKNIMKVGAKGHAEGFVTFQINMAKL